MGNYYFSTVSTLVGCTNNGRHGKMAALIQEKRMSKFLIVSGILDLIKQRKNT